MRAALKQKILGNTSPLALRADLARAIRAVSAFILANLIAQWIGAPAAFAFAAIAAQEMTFFDVRGDYRLRIAILACAALVLTFTAALGAATADSLTLALIAAAATTPAMVLWRHLNADNGPQLAVTSMLLFLLSHQVTRVSSLETIGTAAAWTLGGAILGIVVQVIPWFFRPQQPLRAAVAEAWIAVAELFEAGAGNVADDVRHSRLMAKEAALRTALDKTYAGLASARTRRSEEFLKKLEHLTQTAARLGMRVGAVRTAIDSAPVRPGEATLGPAFHPILVSLANHARTVALAVVSRQPAHLALADVRVRRLQNLFSGFVARLDAYHARETHLAELCALAAETVRESDAALRATIDRAAERAAFSLELTDTDTWSLRPLGAALNLRRPIDPVFVRFMIRVTVLVMIGIVIVEALELAHSYWLPFTVVVVLQPDYGTTRYRALYRTAGTLAGAVLAVGLLQLHLPPAVTIPLMTVFLFFFAFFLRRNTVLTSLAVTIFVVLLTGRHEPLTAAVAWERLAANSLGAVLALAGAFAFWPVWENTRFAAILAAAIRANLHYWQLISIRRREGGGFDPELVRAKQRVEAANANVFASLMRLSADPEKQRAGLEQAAALANGNQRLTRAFSVVALRLQQSPDPAPAAAPDPFPPQVTVTLETVADAIEGSPVSNDALRACREVLSAEPPPPDASAPAPAGVPRQAALAGQRGAIVTELLGLLVATENCRSLGLFLPASASANGAAKRIS